MEDGFFVGPSSIDLHCREGRFEDPDCSMIDELGVETVGETVDSVKKEGSSLLSGRLHNADSEKLRDLTANGSIALGTVKLHDADGRTWIRGRERDDVYPHTLITQGLSNGWLRLDSMSRTTSHNSTYLRVYALPEDVGRSRRGNMKDYRKVVAYILPFIDRSAEAWHGVSTSDTLLQAYEMPMCPEESLFYTFNTLRSPAPGLKNCRNDNRAAVATTNIFDDCLCGLKTPLYAYQKRSTAVMIQKETRPRKLGDPRKARTCDMNGTPFYLDVSTGALFKDQPLYTEPRGGILAETMGYGKTLICLALILATRGRYPEVPPDRVDEAFLQPQRRVGSLLAMAARRLRHEGVSWKSEFYELGKAGYHYTKCVTELQKYNRPYFEPIYTPTTPRRQHANRVSGVKIHLCCATLVIVPPNLIIQWQQEIAKHIEDGALDTLVVTDPKTDIPHWSELCKYDIVLMSKARFEREFHDDDLRKGKKSREQGDYRSPLCDVRWLRVICDEGHGFAGASRKTNAMAMLDKMFIERRWVVSGTPSNTLHGVEVGLSSGVECELSMAGSSRRDSIRMSLDRQRVPTHENAEAKDLERLRLIVVNFLKLQPWTNGRGSGDQADWKTYLGPRVGVDGTRYSSPTLREVMQSLIVRHRIEDIGLDLQLPPLYNKITYLKPTYHDKLTMNNFIMALLSNYVTSEREDEDYMFHPRNRKKLDLLISNMRNATFHWIGWTDEMLRETIRVSRKYMGEKSNSISEEDKTLMLEAIDSGERALADPGWRAMSKLHEIGVYAAGLSEAARQHWALDGVDRDPILMGTTQARALQRHVNEQADRGHAAEEGLIGAGIKAMAAARKKVSVDENSIEVPAEVENPDKSRMRNETAEAPKLRGASKSSKHSAVRVHSRSRATTNPPPATPSITPTKSSATSQIFPSTRSGATTGSPISTRKLSSSQTVLDLLLPPIKITSFTSAKLTYLIHRILFTHPAEKTIIFYSHNNTAYFVADVLELVGVNFRIYANTLPTHVRAGYLARFCEEEQDIEEGENGRFGDADRDTKRYDGVEGKKSASDEIRQQHERYRSGKKRIDRLENGDDDDGNQSNNTGSSVIDTDEFSPIKVLLMDLAQASQGLHIAAASRIYILAPIWDASVESQAIKRAHRIGQQKTVFVETLVLGGTFEEELVRRRDNRGKNGGMRGQKVDETRRKGGSGVDKLGKSLLDDTGIVRILKDIRPIPYDTHAAEDRTGYGEYTCLPRPIPLFDGPDRRQQQQQQHQKDVRTRQVDEPHVPITLASNDEGSSNTHKGRINGHNRFSSISQTDTAIHTHTDAATQNSASMSPSISVPISTPLSISKSPCSSSTSPNPPSNSLDMSHFTPIQQSTSALASSSSLISTSTFDFSSSPLTTSTSTSRTFSTVTSPRNPLLENNIEKGIKRADRFPYFSPSAPSSPESTSSASASNSNSIPASHSDPGSNSSSIYRASSGDTHAYIHTRGCDFEQKYRSTCDVKRARLD